MELLSVNQKTIKVNVYSYKFYDETSNKIEEFTLTEKEHNEILTSIKEGRKLIACKIINDATQYGLRDVKIIVDNENFMLLTDESK